MAAADRSTTLGDNPTAKPTLKDLHQDPNVQSELKSLMDSLGEPVLVGLTKEEQDPARQLLEPTSSRGKHPLLIPDFIGSLPIILQEDRETVLSRKFHSLSGQRLKVMQYDDLYRRMQFATNCTGGTDSQFISHQTLHRPY